MYTTTFRNIVRLAVDNIVDRQEGSPIVWRSWTDKQHAFAGGNQGSDRVVTYNFLRGGDQVFDEVKRLMDLVGIDAESQGVRVSYSGYLKCNCTINGTKL